MIKNALIALLVLGLVVACDRAPVVGAIPTATLQPTATQIATETLPPSPTTVPSQTATATATLTLEPTLVPTSVATATFTPGPTYTGRPVIADYMMWYQPSTFDGTKTFDIPEAGPYNSDDPATIQRQLALAQQACLTGLAPHWYGVNDARTTTNLNTLFAMSANTNLQHSVLMLGNILPGADEDLMINSIKYLLDHWAYGPNYLKINDKPVLLFVDMNRPWGNDSEALAGWARIRAATDPDHKTIWMAEGLTTAYNPLFDGLYIYRLDHRDYPQSWLQQPRWAVALHDVSVAVGHKLLFADSIAAGFDDTRSANAPGDHRLPAPPFARDRENGQYYRDTYAVTARTFGDFMIVKSFNEWIEGTAIEPGKTFGDLYINLTCELANDYRSKK